MYEFYLKIGSWTFQVLSCFPCPDELLTTEGVHPKPDFVLEILTPYASSMGDSTDIHEYSIQQGNVHVQNFSNQGSNRIRVWFKNDWWYQGYTVIEMMLVRAFYSLAKKENYKSFLMHASAVVRKEVAYLFLGPSESGKTTIAGLSQNKGLILHDELVVVHTENSRSFVQGTPFHSNLPIDFESLFPLGAMFILKPSGKISFQPIHTKQAFIQILRQAAPPISFEYDCIQINDVQLDATFDFSKKLANTVPVYVMEFSLKDNIWPVIETL